MSPSVIKAVSVKFSTACLIRVRSPVSVACALPETIRSPRYAPFSRVGQSRNLSWVLYFTVFIQRSSTERSLSFSVLYSQDLENG